MNIFKYGLTILSMNYSALHAADLMDFESLNTDADFIPQESVEILLNLNKYHQNFPKHKSSECSFEDLEFSNDEEIDLIITLLKDPDQNWASENNKKAFSGKNEEITLDKEQDVQNNANNINPPFTDFGNQIMSLISDPDLSSVDFPNNPIGRRDHIDPSIAAKDQTLLPIPSLREKMNTSDESQQPLKKVSRKRKRFEDSSSNFDYSDNNEVEKSNQNKTYKKNAVTKNKSKRPTKKQKTHDNTGNKGSQLSELLQKTLKVIKDLNFDGNNTDDDYWNKRATIVIEKLSKQEGDISFGALMGRTQIIKEFLPSGSTDKTIIGHIHSVCHRKYEKEERPLQKSKQKRGLLMDLINECDIPKEPQNDGYYDKIVNTLIEDIKKRTGQDITAGGIRAKILRMLHEEGKIPKEKVDFYENIGRTCQRIHDQKKKAKKLSK